jgi:hypothetical protein
VELSTRVDIKAHRDEEDRHYAEAASEQERVGSTLGRMGRLPPPDPELTLPILLSIESMYAELNHASDDGERYSIVREAFPNQTHLRVALSALIRLLDPSSRSLDSLHEADEDSLISMLLLRSGGSAAAMPRQITMVPMPACCCARPPGSFPERAGVARRMLAAARATLFAACSRGARAVRLPSSRAATCIASRVDRRSRPVARRPACCATASTRCWRTQARPSSHLA